MSEWFGPRRSGRARAPVFRHAYCTINHRSPQTAARCANSAPVRARREAAERKAAQIAAARAAKIAAASAARAARAADKAAAREARHSQRRQAKAARSALLPTGARRPHRRALFTAIIVALLLIGVPSAVLAAHHGPGTRTSALSAQTNRTLGGQHQSGPPGHPHHPARPPGAGCRAGNPLANVYHEDRLKVRNPCLTITGTVAYVVHEDDGDIHVDLSLPPSEAHLLSWANMAYQSGHLVTEIVPADEPGCTPGRPPRPPRGSYNYGICTGADISAPPVGARVIEIGPYVLDAGHGWMEIHPVWAIKVISRPPSPPPPPAPATTTAPAPRPPPTPPPTPKPAGARCTASASPAHNGYPDDYVYVTSNQPDMRATAYDSGHSWYEYTNGSGSATILLWNTPPGSTITVTVGAASCSTTAA